MELAKKMDILLIPYSKCSVEKRSLLMVASKEGVSCFDSSRGRKYIIYFNDQIKCKQRIRFTIMHEIGHIVLEHGASSEQTESEADFFARNALAPMPIMIDRKIYNLEEIQETFDISEPCAINVLRTLNARIEKGYEKLFSNELKLVQMFK